MNQFCYFSLFFSIILKSISGTPVFIEDIGRPRVGTVVCELHQNKKMQALGTSENINEENHFGMPKVK